MQCACWCCLALCRLHNQLRSHSGRHVPQLTPAGWDNHIGGTNTLVLSHVCHAAEILLLASAADCGPQVMLLTARVDTALLHWQDAAAAVNDVEAATDTQAAASELAGAAARLLTLGASPSSRTHPSRGMQPSFCGISAIVPVTRLMCCRDGALLALAQPLHSVSVGRGAFYRSRVVCHSMCS